MTLSELTMTIQEAVNKGLVAARVAGAGPGVTSRVNLSLNPTPSATGPMEINIPRGTLFWPLDSSFQVHPTTQEKNVTVPLGGSTVVEIPALCGDVFGKQPAPVDGSVDFIVKDPSPFFNGLFDTIENSTGNLTGMANGFGIPIQVYIPTVAQWTVWSFFSDPPFVPTIDPVTGEMHCFFSGDPVAVGDQVCNGCGVPFRRVTMIDGRLVVDNGGGQTPAQDGGSGARNSWTNLTGAGVAVDRKEEHTSNGGSTPTGPNTYTPAAPFNIDTGLAIISDQFSGRNVDDDTKKQVATGLFDGVDFTSKSFLDPNKMLAQVAQDLMFNNPGPDTPPPFRDKLSGLVMEYHNKTQFHPKGWILLADHNWHPPKNWRRDPATGVWWVTDPGGRPNHPAFYFQVGDKWFPPVGMENAMSVRSNSIAKANSLQNTPQTIAGVIDNEADGATWFFAKTYYDFLDAFSGGTLSSVEKQDNLGTLEGWKDAGGTGLWNFGNMASFGVATHVYDTLMKDPELKAAWDALYDDSKGWGDKALAFNAIIAISTRDVGKATLDAVVDMIPKAEIEVMMDPNATEEQKVKAGFMAVAKIANMIAIILGLKAAASKSGAPESPGTGERPTAEGPVSERPTVEPGPEPGKTVAMTPEQQGIGGQSDTVKMEPGQASGSSMNDQALQNVPQSPGEAPGTRIPEPLSSEPSYLKGTSDPAVDPNTGEPLREVPSTEELMSKFEQDLSVKDFATRWEPELSPANEAAAFEVRELDYANAMEKGGLTAEQRAFYENQHAADMEALRSKGQDWWDQVTDAQTKANLEAMRNSAN